jgi:hypothetical protein
MEKALPFGIRHLIIPLAFACHARSLATRGPFEFPHSLNRCLFERIREK